MKKHYKAMSCLDSLMILKKYIWQYFTLTMNATILQNNRSLSEKQLYCIVTSTCTIYSYNMSHNPGDVSVQQGKMR